MNTHTIVANIQQDMSRIREDAGGLDLAVCDMRMFQHFKIHTNRIVDTEQVRNLNNQETRHLTFVSSMPGELPPPPPRNFFGRDELTEKVVHLAERLTPVALIGAGGIGKTSIALTVLHDDRIKQRFGENRRFIRCDEFPATRNHFLRQLSTVIGAGVKNPENLASLRKSLSSKEMFIVLDNAESILDSEGPSAREIHGDVDELTQFGNICICITSRISTIPPDCETLEIPTLSTEAARNAFYRIYKRSERPDSINNILEQLEFHPLSITLLATIAQQSKWGTDRLIAEWERQRTGVLHVQHSKSLATTIELSIGSPMFQELGPDARLLLEVVAFFPQGLNEKNTDRLFLTTSNVQKMLDRFCILSLAYRNNGFITMLAPLRDHLRPKDPASSPLLNTAKENYFARLSGEIYPGKPGFEEARWITTEDINVEHLLDVFTTIDADSKSNWDFCAKFMAQLYWHKSRLVTLGPKIWALPDNHPSKPQCLWDLSRLFDSVGNFVECKQLLIHALKLWRGRGDDPQVALTLRNLSDINRHMNLYAEGIVQAKGASEIFGRLGYAVEQADSLINLAWLLCDANQLNAAEEAGSCAIGLLPEEGEELLVCQGHRLLGNIYQSRGETKKAVHHLEVALGVASSLNWVKQIVWIHSGLADVFSKARKFDDAQAHIEHAKSLAANDTFLLAFASLGQARLWHAQDKLGEAKSEALRALDVFEKLGATNDVECIRWFLWRIDAQLSGQPGRP